METSRVKGVYKRNDGRWEARYVKGYSENGRAMYGAVYGQTEEEVIAKRSAIFYTEYYISCSEHSKDTKFGEGVTIMLQSTVKQAEIGNFCI